MDRLLGREQDLQQLQELWESAQRGAGRIAVVTAEAGGGKTSLLRKFVEHFGASDVLWGSCHDGAAAPPFSPWLAILPAQVASSTFLVPPSSEPVLYEHFRSAALALTSRPSPTIVVLDDVHWADGSSLRFLEFLAPLVWRSNLLVLVAGRPTTAPAIQATLGTLLREGAIQIRLRPLGADDVAAIFTANGLPLDARVAQITGGSPLLVQEYSRHLSAGGDPTGVPDSLTALLHAELRRLSAEAHRAAEVASLMEGPIQSAVVSRAATVAAKVFDELTGAGMLVRSGDALRWRHDALQEAVRAGIPDSSRTRIEAELANASRALGLRPEMAIHGCRAGAEWSPLEAHEAAMGCARELASQYALDVAIDFIALARSVRQLLQLEASERLHLEIFEGQILTRAGRQAEAQPLLREAAALARTQNDPNALAEVALTFGLGTEHGNARTDGTVGLLRQALEALPEDAHALRAKLLSRLAWQVLAAGEVAPREALSAEALREARMAEDPCALATALLARCWALVRPSDFNERLAAAREASGAARDCGDFEVRLGALFQEFLITLTLGDVAAAREACREFDELTAQSPLPYHRWYAHLWKSTLAAADGDPQRAQQHLDELDVEASTQPELARLNRDSAQGEAWAVAGGGMAARGLELTIEALDRELHLGWLFRPRLLAHTGERTTGLRALSEAMDTFETLAVDEDWLAIGSELAAAAVALDAKDIASRLIVVLEPYADLWVVLGNGACCRGPLSSFLAALARVAGDSTLSDKYAQSAGAELDRAGVKGLRHWLDLTPVVAEAGQTRPRGLTPREAEVLTLVARGHSNDEIAEALVLSVRTVQRHVENVYRRLGLHNRAEATLSAVEMGLVSPRDVRERPG